MQPAAPDWAEIASLTTAGNTPDELKLLGNAAHVAAAVRSISSQLAAPDVPPRVLASILEDSSKSPSPQLSLNGLDSLLSLPDLRADLRGLLFTNREIMSHMLLIFGFSGFLTQIVLRFPENIRWLFEGEDLHRPRSRADYETEAAIVLSANQDSESCKQALCHMKQRELLRVATRDMLGLAPIEELSREISDLAQSLISAVSAVAWKQTVARYGQPVCETSDGREQVCGMCVIGMGKLGGRELNFASDIDLIFIYDAEGYTTGVLSSGRRIAREPNHLFFTRMGEAIVKLLGERGPEGNLFRVDMRLRPEGKTGPLTRSLESFINYLSEQARDWERLAYLKARVLGGPDTLADRLYAVIDQFVFSDVPPQRIVREVENLKLMIDREVINSDIYRREVKRGYGGIREIEFIVSTMQIIYGKTHRALHVRNIFVAMQRLLDVNLLTKEEADFYFEAYEFLRMVEHRLQMADERQTHTLPMDHDSLHVVARRCHFPDTRSFLARYSEVTEGVHRRFGRFFEQNIDAIGREAQDLLLILNRDAQTEQAVEALERLGMADPSALPLIHDLTYGTREVFISAEGQRYFEQMLPSLLRLAMRVPRPRRVLSHLHSFVLTIKGITYYYELIAKHPDILNLLTTLFGTSDYFSQAMITHPQFFEALISSHMLYERETVGEKGERMRASTHALRLMDKRLVLLRRSVKFELLLVALRYMLQLRTLRETLASISQTADQVVALAMPMAARRAAERFSPRTQHRNTASLEEWFLEIARTRFTVLALGKYGGQEINFFSDLDVVYVYNDSTPANAEAIGIDAQPEEIYSVLADALAFVVSENLEEGRAFVLDARLRPHGRNAPVAAALSHYISYMATETQVWELQSFARARVVWGSQEVLVQLREAAAARAAAFGNETIRQEIVAMRKRLEESVAGSRDPELKRAPGGIVDVEFLVQYLALTGQLPLARAANCFGALQNLESAGVLAFEDAEALAYGYNTLRSAETAVRLITGSPDTALPADPELLHAASELLRDSTSAPLADKLGKTMKRIREIYDLVLGGTPQE